MRVLRVLRDFARRIFLAPAHRQEDATVLKLRQKNEALRQKISEVTALHEQMKRENDERVLKILRQAVEVQQASDKSMTDKGRQVSQMVEEIAKEGKAQHAQQVAKKMLELDESVLSYLKDQDEKAK